MKKETNIQNQNAVIKRSTALLLAAVCLAIGFLLGFLSSSVFSGGTEVRKMTLRQTETQTETQAPVQAQGPMGQQPNPQLAGAISALEQAVAVDPKNAEAWARLGHTYFDNNDPNNAIRAYKKHLELNPNNADVWTDMGIMYRAMGNPTEAIRCFDKAIEIDPRHRQSRYNKGVVLMHDLEDPEAAVKAWEELVKIFPDAKTQDGRPLKDLIDTFRTPPPQPK